MVSGLNIFVWNWSKIAIQKKVFFFWLIWPEKRFPIDKRLLVEGRIAYFGIFLVVLSFCVSDDFFFHFSNNSGLGVFLVHPDTTVSHGLGTSGQRAYH